MPYSSLSCSIALSNTMTMTITMTTLVNPVLASLFNFILTLKIYFQLYLLHYCTEIKSYDYVLDFCHTAITLITDEEEGMKLMNLIFKVYREITGDDLPLSEFSSLKTPNITPKRKSILFNLSKVIFSSKRNSLDLDEERSLLDSKTETVQINKVEEKLGESNKNKNENDSNTQTDNNIDNNNKIENKGNENKNINKADKINININDNINEIKNSEERKKQSLNSKLIIKNNEKQTITSYTVKLLHLKLEIDELLRNLEEQRLIKENMLKDENCLGVLLFRNNELNIKELDETISKVNGEKHKQKGKGKEEGKDRGKEEGKDRGKGDVGEKKNLIRKKKEIFAKGKEKGRDKGKEVDNNGCLTLLKENIKKENNKSEENEKITSRFSLHFTPSSFGFKPLPSTVPCALHRNSPAVALSTSCLSGNYDIVDGDNCEDNMKYNNTNNSSNINNNNNNVKNSKENSLFDYSNNNRLNIINNYNSKTSVSVVNENLSLELSHFDNMKNNNSKNIGLSNDVHTKQKLKTVPKTHREIPNKPTKAEMKSPQKNLRTFKPLSLITKKSDKHGNCIIC